MGLIDGGSGGTVNCAVACDAERVFGTAGVFGIVTCSAVGAIAAVLSPLI